jgi:anti-sigma regulatory factor (Ser/Thr protein kinase)
MRKKFGRNLAELKDIVALTDRFFAEERIDPSLRYIVDLCIEELFVNMITYNTETDARILVELSPTGQGVEVSLTDFDVERFDPRSVKPPDTEAPLAQRTPGGLGLYLVMKMADSVHYEYRNRTSRFTCIAGRK